VGGSLTAEVAGLPADGEWAVRDDDYGGPDNYDNWTLNETGGQIDWTWNQDKTDGGAYEGLGDEFTITVDPSFNEDAELYGAFYDGTVTDWTTLSGDRADPDRRALDLSEPVRISTRSCEDLTADSEDGDDGDGLFQQEQSVTVQQEQGGDDEGEQNVTIEQERNDEDEEAEREADDDVDDFPGNSGNAPGRSGEAPGNSGNAPGQTGSAPGNGGGPGR
jgi:hypothetical protein